MNPPPTPDDAALRERLRDGELYRLASLVGTDAKTPFANLVVYVARIIQDDRRALLERLASYSVPVLYVASESQKKVYSEKPGSAVPAGNIQAELDKLNGGRRDG